jgi:hypothetical protein
VHVLAPTPNAAIQTHQVTIIKYVKSLEELDRRILDAAARPPSQSPGRFAQLNLKSTGALKNGR